MLRPDDKNGRRGLRAGNSGCATPRQNSGMQRVCYDSCRYESQGRRSSCTRRWVLGGSPCAARLRIARGDDGRAPRQCPRSDRRMAVGRRPAHARLLRPSHRACSLIYRRSSSVKPAIFIKWRKRPSLRSRFPWTGTVMRSRRPSFPYEWWLPRIERSCHPCRSRILAKAFPEIDFIRVNDSPAGHTADAAVAVVGIEAKFAWHPSIADSCGGLVSRTSRRALRDWESHRGTLGF